MFKADTRPSSDYACSEKKKIKNKANFYCFIKIFARLPQRQEYLFYELFFIYMFIHSVYMYVILTYICIMKNKNAT